MIGARSATADLFAALLRGDAVPWAAFGMPGTAFLDACDEEGVTGLVYERIRGLRKKCDWPRSIREALAGEVRAQAARELLHHRELTAVLDGLSSEGLSPILLKGTALAYSVYATPSSRPRIDTDLFVPQNEVDRFRRVLTGLGYTAPVYCDGDLLFCQFPLVKPTRFGVVHRLDCHWKISTQSVFAEVLTFDEVASRAVPLPAFGAHATTLAPLDALLLACIHPVMHHRNHGSLLWLYDIHLLASLLSERDFERFAEIAVAKRVSTICVHQLRTVATILGTRIPELAIRTMTVDRSLEPSAVYLRPDRRWLDELISNVRGLPRWSDRLRLLREVALPGPAYMLKVYGFAWSPSGLALLPFLYLHRLSFGGWRRLAGHDK